MSGSRHWRPYGRKPVRTRRDDSLARMNPLEFERLMGDYFRRQGYTVEHVGTGGSASRYDGGIDLKLYRDGEYTVVQCKRENAYQVTHNVMHELLGVMLTERATRAIVINTGEFTTAAWQKAANEPRVQLVDGDQLREMLAFEGGLASRPEVEAAPAWEWDLSAPRTRPHGGPKVESGRSQSRPRAGGGELMKLALCVVVLIALWQCSRRVSDLARPARPAVGRAQEAPQVEPSSRPPPTQMPVRPVVAEPQVQPTLRPDPTPQELRRQQERADEAMKVIEASTPEM